MLVGIASTDSGTVVVVGTWGAHLEAVTARLDISVVQLVGVSGTCDRAIAPVIVADFQALSTLLDCTHVCVLAAALTSRCGASPLPTELRSYQGDGRPRSSFIFWNPDGVGILLVSVHILGGHTDPSTRVLITPIPTLHLVLAIAQDFLR
jgi:hypothetical protein